MSVERTLRGREAVKQEKNDRQGQRENLTMQGVNGLYAGREATFNSI